MLSPWRVVAAQAGFGALIAVLAWLVTGSRDVAASALYGALVVVIPAALRVLKSLVPDLETFHAEAGFECLEKHGTPLPEEME